MARLNKAAKQTGINLKSLRRHLGLSQNDLANRLQVSQPHIAQLESQTDMHVQTLQRYIAALGGSLLLAAQLPDGTHDIHLDSNTSTSAA
ncbi:MAG: XRE family transcriptional regulator [Dechloromonas agitata]|uniref:XRE family transcriptional regulator n=1 Tax=Dechloromonas agitata TaxID=73030 RepID=A0A930G1K0_9RHOO|nr:XRE family transcriptional regulator [Dechloromonas agitata]